MNDKDREAFEVYCKENGLSISKRKIAAGEIEYMSVTTRIAVRAFNAARDHYAPKLTEKEAVELLRPYLHFGTSGWKKVADAAVNTLKAAGVRFKEEA